MIIKKTAFCSKTTCCPTISIDTDSNTVTLTDDFGGTVKMSVEQWVSIVGEAINISMELEASENNA